MTYHIDDNATNSPTDFTALATYEQYLDPSPSAVWSPIVPVIPLPRGLSLCPMSAPLASHPWLADPAPGVVDPIAPHRAHLPSPDSVWFIALCSALLASPDLDSHSKLYIRSVSDEDPEQVL